MSASDHRQVTTIVQRLGGALAVLNPLVLVATVRRVLRELVTPPPGDPAELRAMAGAFRAAADAVESVGPGIRAAGAMPAASGDQVIAAGPDDHVIADAVGTVPGALREAAAALDELAQDVEYQRRQHAALGTVRRIRGRLDVYTGAVAAADRAARMFADLAGRARVAAAVAGGFEPADAVVLAGWDVRIRGIGDDYDDGILTTAQLTQAGRRLAGATPQDRAAIHGMLAGAGSDTERGYLLKAVAADHLVADLARLADAIRGRDDDWLHGHLTLIDRGGAGEQDRFGKGVDQCDPYTCGTTSLIVARAEADPLYALSLTGGDPPGFDERLTAEQRRVHDATNLIYPERWGTTPEGMADWLTEQAGTPYRWHLVDDTDRRKVSTALREVVAAVDAGYPVPILVGGAAPRHYVLAVGHAAGDLLIFEPTAGATVRVPSEDFLGGRLAGAAGFDHVQAVVLPVAQASDDVELPR